MQSLASRREGWSWDMGEGINARSWLTAPTRRSFVLSAGQQVRVAFSLRVLFLVCCSPQGCTLSLAWLDMTLFLRICLSVIFSLIPSYIFFGFPCFWLSFVLPPNPHLLSLVSFQDHSLQFISLWPLGFFYFSSAWVQSVYSSLNLFLSSTLHLLVSFCLYSSPSLSPRKLFWHLFQ